MYKNIIVLVCIILAGAAPFAFSAVNYNQWNGAAGDKNWNNGANWALGHVPFANNGTDQEKAGDKTPGNFPVIDGATSSPIPEAWQVTIGGTGGEVDVNSGGILNISQYITLAAAATETGYLKVNGGTITCGQGIFVGQLGIGVLTMNGGAITLTGNLSIADNGASANGTVRLNGGTITVNGALRMKYASTGTALLDVNGGTLIVAGDQRTLISGFGSMIIACGGLGTLNVDYNNVNPGKTTVTSTLALPQATNPNPGNLSSGVSLTPTLSWTAGIGAVSHNVYFGTSTSPDFQINQAGTTFNPATLANATTYYWRVDEVNAAGGVTAGTLWNFTTTAGQAASPSPLDGATNVSLTPTLSWSAGAGAASHTVYFGTVSPGDSQGNQAGTTFTPSALAANTAYFWRIDEVNGTSVITGVVWRFTTAPAKAYSPSPANAATNIALNAALSWSPGGGAVSHDVYFGTISPGTLQGNQAATTFNPGTLTANATYYWRIDERDASNNVTTGDIWSFTTANYSVYPYLSWKHDPTNSMVVNWWNPYATGDSTVQYGLTTAYGSTVNVSTVSNFHHVELTGLAPSTTYHYSFSSSDGTIGTDRTFTTADVMTDANTFSFSFAMYGDPRSVQNASEPYNTYHRNVCNWIASGGYKFALETGDIVWGGGISAGHPLDAQNYYLDFYNIEQNLAGTKAIMATMGNHEVQPVDQGGTVTYTYYYDLYTGAFPANAIVNGTSIDNKGRIYSFNYGNAHFVSMSSYQFGTGVSETPWLIQDLNDARSNPNIKWIFVMMHAPLYTSTGHQPDPTMVASWTPVFEQYGVDLVFAGHNHCYERTYPIRNGLPAADGRAPIYITNGMGGAEFNPTAAGNLFAARYGSDSPNPTTVVTTITINGLHLTVDTIKNATGVPVDSFTLQKTPPPIAGDFNGDYKVNELDLGLFGQSWLDNGIFP